METGFIMWSVKQIADRDNVSKQAVSKAVKKLLDDQPETPLERGGMGQVLRISVAHYDRFRQRFVNPAKAKAEIRSATEQPAQPGAPAFLTEPKDSFDEARRVKEWIAVDRERLKQQELLGNLMRKDMVDQAVVRSGIEIQAALKRLPNKADDLALAVSKEGVHGARVLLRQIAFELGNEIADKLGAVAEVAPAADEMLEDDLT